MHASSLPLCVDLDGTFLRTDTVWESVALLLKKHPLRCVQLPFWLLQGKAYAKNRLAESVTLDVVYLPVQKKLLAFLQEQKDGGRSLILVTGAPQSIADAVAQSAGMFQEVIASTPDLNLTGERKASELVRRFGEGGFDYAGNARPDLHVWSHARECIVVNAPRFIRTALQNLGKPVTVIDDRVPVIKALLKAVRPHQWMKNILIFVPVITAHQLQNQNALVAAVLAFIAFCLSTSSVYLLNDLLDLPADRRHMRKHRRPLASGDLPILTGMIAAPLFLSAGLTIASVLPIDFLWTLLSYFTVTLAYSFYLKQIVLIDVLVLAMLYTVRIVAGHTATGIAYSEWLLLFALTFFFSLALVKRYAEIRAVQASGSSIAGRGYDGDDRARVRTLGVLSGAASALVLAFYITGDHVTSLYQRPYMLWILVPLMLFWITRVWLLARKGVMHDDPVIFALKDPVSYALGVCIAVVMALAS